MISLSDTSNPGRQLYTHAILHYVRENRSSGSKTSHQRVNKASCRGLLHGVPWLWIGDFHRGAFWTQAPFLMSVPKESKPRGKGLFARGVGAGQGCGNPAGAVAAALRGHQQSPARSCEVSGRSPHRDLRTCPSIRPFASSSRQRC